MQKILQMVTDYAKGTVRAVMHGSGTVALYLLSSLLLAGLLMIPYLIYAWGITPEQWSRAFQILQGVELEKIQQAERDAVAGLTHEAVKERRALRNREREFEIQITRQAAELPSPPVEEPPPPPPMPTPEEILAEQQRLSRLTGAQAAGLAEFTRLLEEGDPDWSKEVIRRYWAEGQNRLVLQALMDMEDKGREDILYAMLESNDEELKDLTEIMLRIARGDPRAAELQEAANNQNLSNQNTNNQNNGMPPSPTPPATSAE